jgi:gliding motility-associated-like protein
MKAGSLFLSSSLSSGLYEWSTGEKVRSIRVSEPGRYFCKAYIGCSVFLDSFYVVGDTFRTMHNVRVCDSNKISSTLSSPETSGRYRWNTGDTQRHLFVTRAGDYHCVALSGCKVVIDSFHFIVSMPTLPVVHDTVICQYVPPPVLAVHDTDIVWFTDPGSTSYSEEQPLIPTNKVQRITLYAGKKGGDCIGPLAPITVTIQNKPQPQPPMLILHCNDVIDSGRVLGTPVPADVSYLWNTGETVCCISPVQDGRYIRVAVNGCGKATDTFTLRAEPCQHCIEFPTAFTPNGDHRNDAFGGLLRCPVDRYRMNIYNRWGELVYTTGDKYGRWDGYYKGSSAPAGTYMYMASMVHSITGEEILAKGTVIVIR